MCLNEFVQTMNTSKKNLIMVKVIALTSKEVKDHGLNVLVTSQTCSNDQTETETDFFIFSQPIILSHEVASSPHRKTATSFSSHNMCHGIQNDSRLEF